MKTILTLIFALMLTTASANTGTQTTYEKGKFYTIDGARYKCIGFDGEQPKFQGFTAKKPAYHPNKRLTKLNKKAINQTKH